MRVLSPVSDASAPAPLLNEAKQANSMAIETTKPASAGTPSISVTSKMPIMHLDTDVVSDNMAARLCVSFLGHVLFLKNQIPFPIVQLAKMPVGDNTTRAFKKRHDLLNSFDTLSSHLYTTFIALSTALALRGSPEAEAGTKLDYREYGISRAFFTIALGPTIGTAKSRVIVGIDGLETRVWGLREDCIPEKQRCDEDDDGAESSNDTDDEGEDGQSEDEECGDSTQEETAESSGSDNGIASPPLSRSPSPTPSSDSDSLSTPSSRDIHSKPMSTPVDDPETIRAAERLLSRTLASACAEDDGQGLASEMAPTQIHVLLRAPRRFNHPSWIPRQNLCASMDIYLAEFLEESGQANRSCDTPIRKRMRGSKVQGVWIKSRRSVARIGGSEEALAEADEMIWWSWDGKLAGCADW